MTTINKIAKAGVVGTLLMGAVALKASNPITNVNKTPNQTEIVSKEGAEALKATTLQGVQQTQTIRNQRLDNNLRKFAVTEQEKATVNSFLNKVYKEKGRFWAAAHIQHELDRQQLFILLNEETNLLAKINPALGKEVKAIGPDFYKGVRPNGAIIKKWLKEEYSPSVLGVMAFDHKPTGKEMIEKLDEIAEKKAGFVLDDIIDYHVYSDDFNHRILQEKTDDASLAALAAYKMFTIDYIIFKKTLTEYDFFEKRYFWTKYTGLESYYKDWMESVEPKGK